jgi:Leucine-rich repeat (LRR) protein
MHVVLLLAGSLVTAQPKKEPDKVAPALAAVFAKTSQIAPLKPDLAVTQIGFPADAGLNDFDLGQLIALTKLERLIIEGNPGVTNIGIKKLVALRSLKYLSLERNQTDGACLEALAALPNLTTLDLHSTRIVDDSMPALAKFPKLANLDIRFTPITDAGLKHLEAIKGLEVLRIRSDRITANGLKRLANFTKLKVLETSYRTNDEVLAEIARMPVREELNLGFISRITDAGMAHVAKMKQLKVLHINHTNLTDRGLKLLEPLPNLTVLDAQVLRKITDDGMRSISAHKNLIELNLWYTPPTE